ncbi:hypothetical protein [Thiocystis violacea]|uniref:hypothetical protein n=1 Tax=Thiocystis violacea TaxID=13725 RepID=UPI001902DF2E|nr:hypothetical protein [Thiocystis violacea]MBK1724432.1 hypothetical protein [Thiocystis violacea]
MEAIQQIRVEEIQIPDYWRRPRRHTPEAQALEAAEAGAPLQAVTLRSVGNPGFPCYHLLAGRDTYEIARYLFEPRVPAIVLGRMSQTEALRIHLEREPARESDSAPSPDRNCSGTRDLLRLVDVIQEKMNALRSRQHRYTWADAAKEYEIPLDRLRHAKRLAERLHPEVRRAFEQGRISFGHAKVMTRFKVRQQSAVLAKIFAKKLSVRALEASVRDAKLNKEDSATRGILDRPSYLVHLEEAIRVQCHLDASLGFDEATKEGRITFQFATRDQFDQFLIRLGVDVNRTWD